MTKQRMTATSLIALALVAVAVAVAASASASSSGVSDAQAKNVCPGGKVRFGVEPYDTGAKFLGAYQTLTSLLQKKLHCSVKLYVATSYTAEVEAMRAKKLDVGEFGPLGYIFAKKLAKAQPVAVFATKDRKPVVYYAALWVPSGSSITSVKGLVGKTLALSDPASTSGNLFPLYALKKAGVSQDSVKIQYAGSHSASLLALVNGKVDAAEVNSQQQATASAAGTFDASKYRRIWRSNPIPNDPITVRGDLSPAFKAAVKKALLSLKPAELAALDTELGVDSGPMIAGKDSFYTQIRELVKLLGIDINHIG